MYENQFITLTDDIIDECKIAIPVSFGNDSTSMFIDDDYLEEELGVALLKLDETPLITRTFKIPSVGDKRKVSVKVSSVFSEAEIKAIMSEGSLFVFRLALQDWGRNRYSNPCKFVCDTSGLSVIKYKCEEDCFGFPFNTADDYASALLPILLSAPAYKQEDKTYTKADGTVVVLYAKYYKEWEGETEYLTEEMHDKIMAALSCDEVYINGTLVTKSAEYDVDWDNWTTIESGEKVAKATFKVQANTLNRNSNY